MDDSHNDDFVSIVFKDQMQNKTNMRIIIKTSPNFSNNINELFITIYLKLTSSRKLEMLDELLSMDSKNLLVDDRLSTKTDWF